uniref:Ig-like domain-containing protein n=1 Tax=Macrostomum lignano TaxID=282301 RepID=A0A1I8HFT5_9PLAT
SSNTSSTFSLIVPKEWADSASVHCLVNQSGLILDTVSSTLGRPSQEDDNPGGFGLPQFLTSFILGSLLVFSGLCVSFRLLCCRRNAAKELPVKADADGI